MLVEAAPAAFLAVDSEKLDSTSNAHPVIPRMPRSSGGAKVQEKRVRSNRTPRSPAASLQRLGE